MLVLGEVFGWEFIDGVSHDNVVLIEHLLQVAGQFESPAARRGGKHDGDIFVVEITCFVTKTQSALQQSGK